MKQKIVMNSHLNCTNYKAFVGIDGARLIHSGTSTSMCEISVIKHDFNVIDK